MTTETEPRPDTRRWKLRSARPLNPSEAPPVTPAPPRLPGRRNPRWVALGVVALCLGALLSFVIYSRVADEATVVVVVKTIHRGETVAAGDLTSVSLRASAGVEVVPASQLNQLVGQKAVYDLVGGSLLPVGGIAEVVVPQTGRAVVGVRLVPGRVPVGFLPPGTPLRLIALPPAGADPAFSDQYTGRTFTAREISQLDGADGASTIVNIDVPAQQAPVVALLAAQERLAIVRDADR